ncbi:molecular chaperone DnaJ, partial [Bacillus sp. S34]|nr:molecular chaperone DnaJ [Bacillus sp. S34]
GRVDLAVLVGAYDDLVAVDVDAEQGVLAPLGASPQTCDICGGSGHIQRQVRSLLGNVVTSAPCGTCRGYGTVIPNPCPT